MALYADANSKVSKLLYMTRRHHSTADVSDLLSFEFDHAGKDAQDVDPDLVLPDREGRPRPMVESGKPLKALFG